VPANHRWRRFPGIAIPDDIPARPQTFASHARNP
jgi:hypothetical protein